MRTAKSARVHVILGASLTATIAPGLSTAELNSRQIFAIDSSSGQAIDSSSIWAIDSSSAWAIDSSSGQAIDSSSVWAIDSSSGQAIDSSSVLAIDSSSGQAIDSSSVLAIDSSSGQAIDSSSVLAIDSSSGQAIDSSSVWAIDSSSGQAIDSSSVIAIDSSSGQAIDSSSVLAIDSSSGQAIDSSSVIAIDSSSGQAIDSSSVIAIDSSSGQAIDSSSAMILAGPVESIDYVNRVFVSLGQAVTLHSSSVDQLRVGDFVMVSGNISGSGQIDADAISLTSDPYVPGATEVYVTGIPSSVDYTLGTATIGKLTFDYTPSLSSDNFEGIGAAITVIGTQPALGGIVLSDQVLDRTELFFKR